jgi:hypothetical protein
MSTQPVPSKYSTNKHSPEDIDAALLAFAATGGNASRASRLLKERGIDVSTSTVTKWAERTYPDRYMQIAATHGAELDRVLAEQARGIAMRASEVERLAIDNTEEALKAGEVKDPSAVARNMSVTKGIAVDKTLVLTGRPAQIVEHRSAADLIKKLEKLGIVDSTAVEEEHEELEAGS